MLCETCWYAKWGYNQKINTNNGYYVKDCRKRRKLTEDQLSTILLNKVENCKFYIKNKGDLK